MTEYKQVQHLLGDNNYTDTIGDFFRLKNGNKQGLIQKKIILGNYYLKMDIQLLGLNMRFVTIDAKSLNFKTEEDMKNEIAGCYEDVFDSKQFSGALTQEEYALMIRQHGNSTPCFLIDLDSKLDAIGMDVATKIFAGFIYANIQNKLVEPAVYKGREHDFFEVELSILQKYTEDGETFDFFTRLCEELMSS